MNQELRDFQSKERIIRTGEAAVINFLYEDDKVYQFSHISLDEEYRKKWNVRLNDFFLITKNGLPVRNTLYRLGGLNSGNSINDRFIMLLKHKEAYYDDSITKDEKRKPHLEKKWCILNENKEEVKVFDRSLDTPYLITDSILYKQSNKYYNILTGECYGECYNAIVTKTTVIISSGKSAIIINKLDGTTQVID